MRPSRLCRKRCRLMSHPRWHPADGPGAADVACLPRWAGRDRKYRVVGTAVAHDGQGFRCKRRHDLLRSADSSPKPAARDVESGGDRQQSPPPVSRLPIESGARPNFRHPSVGTRGSRQVPSRRAERRRDFLCKEQLVRRAWSPFRQISSRKASRCGSALSSRTR